MKKRINFFGVIVIVAVINQLSACQSSRSTASSKMMKFGLEEGKGYDYEMIMNMDQEVMGQPIKMDMTTYYAMDVAPGQNNLKTITSTFERFKMDMSVMGMNIVVDSDNPGGNGETGLPQEAMKKVFGILGAIKGKKFIMKVNEEGKIIDMTGFRDMGKNIADSLGLDENERAEMVKKFDEQFNEEGMKGQMERVFHIFPNKVVKVGDSWQKTTVATGPTGGKYISDYTVKEIEGDMVTLIEKTKIVKMDDEGKLSGNLEGTLVVDSKTGLIVNADQEMTMNTSANGMEAEIKVKTKIKGKVRG